MRVALAQIDPTVGAIDGNSAKVAEWIGRAREQGADLVVFPELCIPGYPAEDLYLKRHFLEANRRAVEELAAGVEGITALVGFAEPAAGGGDSPHAYNALAVLADGAIQAVYRKNRLPNYAVFDEQRYFVPGDEAASIELEGIAIGLTVCEDVWTPGGPAQTEAEAGAQLIANPSGSPYHRGKGREREQMFAERAREYGTFFAFCNLVGGQDELVFDGDSMIVAADGGVLARAPQLAEHLLIHDLDLPLGLLPPPPSTPPLAAHSKAELVGDEMGIERVHVSDPHPALPTTPLQGGLAERLSDEAEVWGALVLGLRDYVRKNGFRQVALGLSGGIDSSVVAAIAVDALGPEAVIGVSMPSQHSSAHSREDAAEMAKRTGLEYRVHEIQPMVDTFLTGMSLSGLALENLQARVRGVILMSISNQEGPLVLTTGNKSELAVGYSTLYGDSVGGFNPLRDVPKTLVWKLARWRNDEALRTGEEPPIPERSIEKPPSAELHPGQLDSDSLPDYDELDSILLSYVDGDQGRADLVAAGHDPEVVDRVLHLVDLAEYKRRQSAPGTKISIKAFGRDRRLPITNRWRETG